MVFILSPTDGTSTSARGADKGGNYTAFARDEEEGNDGVWTAGYME
jgi:hypothetical protein